MNNNKLSIKKFFNNKSLNKIAKKYKFKRTIIKKYYNKEEIYKFLNKKAVIIQSNIRRYLAKLYYNHLLNSIKYDKNKYINDSSIIGESIDSIHSQYFINISSHDDNKYFFFDIREIYKIMNSNFINPYTQLAFTTKDIKNIKYHINKLQKNNISLELISQIPKASLITCKITEILTLLSDDSLHVDMSIINSFDTNDYLNVVDQLLHNHITMGYITQSILDTLNNYYNNLDRLDASERIKSYVLSLLLRIMKINDNNETLNFTKKLIIYNAIQFNYEYYNRNSILHIIFNYESADEDNEYESDIIDD